MMWRSISLHYYYYYSRMKSAMCVTSRVSLEIKLVFIAFCW